MIYAKNIRRQFTTCALTIAVMVLPLLTCDAVHVKGYYRKDGTYVAPHYRSGSSASSGASGSYRSKYFTGVTGASNGDTGQYDDPNYDKIMKSLKQCQALNDDGTACHRRALPGRQYCYLHEGSGYKPSESKAHKSKDPIVKDPMVIERDSELRIETLVLIDSLRVAIQQHQVNNGNSPPVSLAEISSVTNDAWGHALYYETDDKDYAIASDGGDGIPNTDDDILFLSNDTPQCQAVLPNGMICNKMAEPGKWYCSSHVSKEDRSCTSKAQRKEKSDKGPPHDSRVPYGVDVTLILLGIVSAVSVSCMTWMRNKRNTGR